MSVYMTRINGRPLDDTMHYKQHMIFSIAQHLGIKEMGLYHYNCSNESDESLSARVNGIIAGIKRGDLVIFQFPTGNGLRFERQLVRTLKAYGARIAVFLQDLEPGSNLWEIANFCNQAEVVIVPSLAMRQILLDNNINRKTKFIIQEMWDYTDDFMTAHAPEFKKEFALIEEEQFPGIQEWPFGLPIKIYGGNIQGGQNVHNINGMRREEVFTEISKGGFGLVWKGDESDSRNMECCASLSLARFLAAGIPVIVPAGISNQSIIEKNRLGLIVHSLDEAVAKVEVMEREEYQEYVHHVENFAPALRKGYYTEKCLIEAMQAFYREDFDRLSTPTEVYSLDDSAFSATVLKESYEGNLYQKKQRIILMNTPDHNNIGDHLITTAELYFFRKYIPEYELIEIPRFLCTKELEYISKYVSKDDLLVIHGGGFLGSLWFHEERNARAIVRMFPDNRIIVFPQTMYFEDSEVGEQIKKESVNIYNAHGNLTFCFRDKLSYELGMSIFSEQITKLYVPDSAMMLDRSDEIYPREGILLCLREDHEQIMSNGAAQSLINGLNERGLKIKKMSMLAYAKVTQANRMDAVNKKLHQVQTSRLVITDRLHCMIMCAISGTPCIAFDNVSSKVSGGYHWIERNPYIRVVDSLECMWEIMQKLLNMNYMVYCHSDVDKEFDKLASYVKSGSV